MTRMTRRAAFGAALVLALPAAALADGDENGVTPLNRNISELNRNITPMQTVENSGGSTTITLQTDILFEFGKAELSDTAAAKIGDVIKDIPQRATVSVDGHTDDIPYSGPGGNQKLSEDRAQAVADAITASRADLNLKVAGHAESQPVEDPSGDDPSAARAKNRRVEIRYGG